MNQPQNTSVPAPTSTAPSKTMHADLDMLPMDKAAEMLRLTDSVVEAVLGLIPTMMAPDSSGIGTPSLRPAIRQGIGNILNTAWRQRENPAKMLIIPDALEGIVALYCRPMPGIDAATTAQPYLNGWSIEREMIELSLPDGVTIILIPVNRFPQIMRNAGLWI